MTPPELKEYVDAALHHRDTFMLVYFVLVPVISLCGVVIAAYLTEKGKNLATKEDVVQITTKIESSKAPFAEVLEHLRADLGSRSHYSKVRYEREMKVYEEVWPKLCAMQEAVLPLRAAPDSTMNSAEAEESRRLEQRKRFHDAYLDMRTTIDHNQPFYPPAIWKALAAVSNLVYDEAQDYGLEDYEKRKGDYWVRAKENRKAVKDQVEETCEAIRSRLAEFDRASGPPDVTPH